MYPRVSVIIPTYNVEHTIGNLLASLFNQSFSKEKTEIIVVDDCSTDNTLDILTNLKHDHNFSVFSHESNKGLAAARNTGIKNALGKILIFIDSDMVVGDHYIENHVNFHNNRQVAGVVGGIVPAETLKRDKYQKYLYRAKRGAKKYTPESSLPYNVFLFNNSSIKREVIDECGMFDEAINVYGGEDTEFAYRIHQQYPVGLFCSYSLNAVHDHYRSLSSALNNLHEFAKINIPYLVQKHPGMSRLYGLKYIDRRDEESNFFYRFLGGIIRLKTFYGINKLFYKISPYPVSNFFLKALMGHKLFTGVKKGLA